MAIDALFKLECGCVMDGCSDSDPGRKFADGVRNGALYCFTHKGWKLLVDVASLA